MCCKKVNIILNAMGQNIGQDFSNKLSLSEENKQPPSRDTIPLI
jgi:hypothetical protein